MKGSKEQYQEIQEERAKEWLVIMDDQIYTSLPSEVRQGFKSATVSYPDEHKFLMENDPNYRNYYKTKREATQEIDKIKFMHREKSRRSS
ncbi:MAG: hypothetical protein AAGF96_06100 [Bacteroidota bacterium]